ncbi:MAG: peroxiredoxin family protein [Planctomycetia bacterium]|nr:peroxiredoxin family protein [Planctomycetia bacterium]
MSVGMLALALLVPTAPPEPTGLQKGDELTFVGTVEEQVRRPGNQFRRLQKLEIRVLVLEQHETSVDVAVLTLLRRTDDAVAGAVGTVTGGTPEKTTPPAARLDLIRVHADGTSHHLHPVGPRPLVFDHKTPARALPAIPLDAFAPFEFGMFPPKPPRAAPDKPWSIASSAPNRPAETWQAQGNEFITAERCALLVMNQQSPNWDKPVGGKTAWHRADAVWVSTLDSTARKVHRVIKHRDGLATELAAWVEVKYQLKDQTRVINHTFDRYRRDVEVAFSTSADVAPLLPEAAKLGPKHFEPRLQNIDKYLKESDPSSPYREAVLAVRRQLDAARRGEAVPTSLGTPTRNVWPEPGRPAADFTAGKFRLSDQRGKLVVLIFFQPGNETTDLTLAIADALHQKYGTRAAIIPLVVSDDVVSGLKDRDRRKLTVPIYDGTQAETAYAVESVPRFVVIDKEGVVKWTFSGVGAETGYSTRVELERLLPLTSPNAPPGTTRPPGTGTGGMLPRP